MGISLGVSPCSLKLPPASPLPGSADEKGGAGGGREAQAQRYHGQRPKEVWGLCLMPVIRGPI